MTNFIEGHCAWAQREIEKANAGYLTLLRQCGLDKDAPYAPALEHLAYVNILDMMKMVDPKVRIKAELDARDALDKKGKGDMLAPFMATMSDCLQARITPANSNFFALLEESGLGEWLKTEKDFVLAQRLLGGIAMKAAGLGSAVDFDAHVNIYAHFTSAQKPSGYEKSIERFIDLARGQCKAHIAAPARGVV